jgi:Zn-dependent peptidase ImmA (M78 family)/transcriptional regulator with XRE-family HTH domain
VSNTSRAAEAAPLFNGARLTLARHLAGLRKNELAQRIDKSPSTVTAWELGNKRPTAANLAQLALGLDVDPMFFVAREDLRVDGVIPHFRSLRSTTQIARDQAFAYGQLAVDVSAAFEVHVEFPALDVPSLPVALDARTEPEEAAREIRRLWGIDAGPFGHVVRTLENHGVLVVFSPPTTASVDAYSFETRTRPVVVLNPVKRDYYRQRYDVAHELGHLVMHHDSEPGGRIVEEQANRFAAELLMPADEIRDALPTGMGGNTWPRLMELKERWGVSLAALLYRARHLGRLSDVSYRNAMITMSSRGWRRDEPGAIKMMEQPSLLPAALDLLATAGIGEEELTQQARTPRNLFDTIVARQPRADARQPASTSTEESAPSARALTSLLVATDTLSDL